MQLDHADIKMGEMQVELDQFKMIQRKQEIQLAGFKGELRRLKTEHDESNTKVRCQHESARHPSPNPRLRCILFHTLTLNDRCSDHAQLEHYEAKHAELEARLVFNLDEYDKIKSKIDELTTEMENSQSKVADMQVRITLSVPCFLPQLTSSS